VVGRRKIFRPGTQHEDAPRHLIRHAGDGAPYLGLRHFGRAPPPRGAARSFDLARGMYLSTELIAQTKRSTDAPRHLFRHAGDGAPYQGVRRFGWALST